MIVNSGGQEANPAFSRVRMADLVEGAVFAKRNAQIRSQLQLSAPPGGGVTVKVAEDGSSYVVTVSTGDGKFKRFSGPTLLDAATIALAR